MDTTCPNCRAPVPATARACPACGLARNLPEFQPDGSYVGTTFARADATPPPALTTLPPSRPTAPRLSGRIVGMVVGIFVLAVVLGVGTAVLLRPGPGLRPFGPGGPEGPATPTTPLPTVQPLPPDPTESPDPPPEGAFGEVSRRVGTGAHRLLATTCSGTGIGTAYQFGTEGMLVASARAVSGAQSLALLSGDRIVRADVVKIDRAAGLAILKPAAPLTGHSFVLGTRQLAAGDRVAALGWTTEAQQPARGKPRTVLGTITEAGVRVESPDGALTVRRMTGAYDPGLAGAPVVGEDGHLLGMVVQGPDDQTELLVAGLDAIADPLLGPTGAMPMPPALEPCAASAGPRVVTTAGGIASPSARTELGQWFGALNGAEWDRARGILAPALQQEWSRERLTEEYAGTYAFNIVTAPDGAGVRVTWVQLASEGEHCEWRAARFTLDQGRINGIESQGRSACG